MDGTTFEKAESIIDDTERGTYSCFAKFRAFLTIIGPYKYYLGANL